MALAATKGQPPKLRSLDPKDILATLDLTKPGLEAANKAKQAGDRLGALRHLLAHYRKQFPLPDAKRRLKARTRKAADGVVKHIFQWGPYEPADYGKDVNWEWDPRGDIEWVADVYRFCWVNSLAAAYRATRNEKYAQAFVELTTDWIAKHPLEQHTRTHYKYRHWRGFAWLDIQTGIRADRLCLAFPSLVHAEAFTPEFLGILLASLHDHQVKTERLPMGKVHNKAVFEQRGFAHVAATFPEFADAPRWMKLALTRTRPNLLAQTTPDGVQREWSFGYHLGVLRDATNIMGWAKAMGAPVPKNYRERVRAMYDYVFAVATPDLGGPMFGDASRPIALTKRRRQWPLYHTLMAATELLGDPKYAARARLDRAALPDTKSYAFAQAGMYVLRNDWGPRQIHLGLHCSPPAISGHDQPDNGTFELYAHGRWLMPDTGFYTYGHDAKARRWHRQSRVHQTLTLDGKDTRSNGRLLLAALEGRSQFARDGQTGDGRAARWHTAPDLDALVVENESYKGLTHRRSVWFVDKRFFVLLDEAIGNAKGALDLHFQLAPGPARLQKSQHWATTGFDDTNVLVWAAPDAPVTMEEETGWFAWKYGHRTPRRAFRFRHAKPAPAAFLTVLFPYKGTDKPQVAAALPRDFVVGASRVELRVEVDGHTWLPGRDLDGRKAWCQTTSTTPKPQ